MSLKIFFLYAFFVVLYDIVRVVIPYIRGKFIDDVLIELNSSLFLKFAIIILTIELIHAIMLFLTDTLYDISMINLTNNARKTIVKKILYVDFYTAPH